MGRLILYLQSVECKYHVLFCFMFNSFQINFSFPLNDFVDEVAVDTYPFQTLLIILCSSKTKSFPTFKCLTISNHIEMALYLNLSLYYVVSYFLLKSSCRDFI